MAQRPLRHRLLVIGFIASPLAVLVILVWAIVLSFERGPSMMAEPVGAGAGAAGGANALGQAIFGRTEEDEGRGLPAEFAQRGVVLVVGDESGSAGPGRPIVLMTSRDGFDAAAALPLERREDGMWEIRLPPPPPGPAEPLTFRFALLDAAGDLLPERDQAGELVGARRLPRIRPEDAAGEEPLTFQFAARAFGRE